MVRTPHVVAHRGLASSFPENTLESIAAAIAAGVQFVEFDIQLSADEVPVVIHDDTLIRTADRSGCVLDMSWTDLSTMTVGESERFGSQFADALLPSLAQARQLIERHPGITAFVEIKTESLSHFGTDRVLDCCVEALDALLPRSVITSFDAAVLEKARERYGAAIAWVLTQWDDESLELGAALQPDFMFCNYKKLPSTPLMLPQGRWEWVIYEVVDVELARALHERGVSFVESMDAGALMRNLLAASDIDDGS